MSKFQKLSKINKDIELLENAGKIKAAEVLHRKFIKEAQYAMPQVMTTMMPQMMSMMPQMMSMMPMTMSRPVVAPATAPRPVANPVVTPAPMPVAQPRTTPVQTIGATPGVSPAPVNPPKPPPPPTTNPVPLDPPKSPYDNYYKDPRTGKLVFVDPVTGDPVDGTPPGTTPPPSGDQNKYSDPMQDPRVKDYWNKIKDNGFLSGKQKQDMLDQFLRSIGLK